MLKFPFIFVCVCRSGLYHPDAARQSELMHQPMDLHSFLQQRVHRAAESASLSVRTWPPRLFTRRLHHHTHLYHQGQPVLTEANETETDTEWHVWKDMHGCTRAPLWRMWRCTQNHHRNDLYLQRCSKADLYQMFPTAKDSCTVNRTLSLITYPLHSSREEGCHWKCQHHFMRVAVMDSIYNERWPWNEAYFHPSCCWVGHVRKKVPPCSDTAEPQECKGVDHCINSLMAHLMYKAAEKAMAVEKSGRLKEQRHKWTVEVSETAAVLRTDMGMTWMLQLQERPWEVSSWNLIMWTNCIKSKKVDYSGMLQAEFIFTQEESGSKEQ